MLEQERLIEMRMKRLTLAVLQGLAGRCRVVDSERSQSRKLRTGADEWAVHTSALWGTLATVVVLMSAVGLTGAKPCQDFRKRTASTKKVFVVEDMADS